MRFRKKPVEVEAHRWTGDNLEELRAWAREVASDEKLFVQLGDLFVSTLEGDMCAVVGCWIICGVRRELYPCAADIFEATYDAVGSGEEAPTEGTPTTGKEATMT